MGCVRERFNDSGHPTEAGFNLDIHAGKDLRVFVNDERVCRDGDRAAGNDSERRFEFGGVGRCFLEDGVLNGDPLSIVQEEISSAIFGADENLTVGASFENFGGEPFMREGFEDGEAWDQFRGGGGDGVTVRRELKRGLPLEEEVVGVLFEIFPFTRPEVSAAVESD